MRWHLVASDVQPSQNAKWQSFPEGKQGDGVEPLWGSRKNYKLSGSLTRASGYFTPALKTNSQIRAISWIVLLSGPTKRSTN